jgi:DNA polymerase-4
MASAVEIAETVDLLLSSIFPVSKGNRLLGVTLSSLDAVDGGQETQLAFAI